MHVDVTAASDSKVYDGNNSSDGIPLVGILAGGDAVNVAPTQTYDNKNAGTGKIMTPTGMTVKDGSGDNMTTNYDIHYVTNITGEISQLHLDVTAVTKTKVYDGNNTSDGIPVIGTLAGSDVINNSPAQTYDNKNVGTGKVLTPAGLTIKDGSDVNMTANYDIHYISRSLGEITPMPLNVTAVADTRIYNGNISSTAVPEVETLAAGDAVNVAPIQVFDTKNVGNGKIMTPSGLTVKDGSNANMTANYDIHYVTVSTGEITQRQVNVNGITDTKIYDGNASSDGVPTVGSLAGSDVVNSVPTQSFDNKNSGTGKVMTPAGLTIKDGSNANMTSNYDIRYLTSSTGIISAKEIDINASDLAKCFGEAKSYSGTEFTTSAMIGDESVTSVTLTSTGSASAAAVGNYDILPSAAVGAEGTDLSNYSITYKKGNLIVNPLPAPVISGPASAMCTIGKQCLFHAEY